MVIQVLSRNTFNKCVLFSLRNFPTSAQPTTHKYYPVLTFALPRNISLQNFSISKPNFWTRKHFSSARPSTYKNSTTADGVHQKAEEFRLLNDSFLSNYKNIASPFGFNGLGEIVYRRTYSRVKADGKKEQWYFITFHLDINKGIYFYNLFILI